jgi:hypothetical protein
MSDNHCTVMELYCMERAKLEPLKRGQWIAQAERWHELGRAQDSWRLQKISAAVNARRPDGTRHDNGGF